MAASHLKAIATLLSDDDSLLSSPLSSPLFTTTDTVSNQQTKFEKKQAERIEKLKATQDRINRMKKQRRSPVKQQQVRRESNATAKVVSGTPANTPVKPIANDRVDNNEAREDKNGIFSPTRPTTATANNNRTSMLVGQPRLMVHTTSRNTGADDNRVRATADRATADRATADRVSVDIVIEEEEATPDSYIGELEEITPTLLLQFNNSSSNGDELLDNELKLVDGLEEVEERGCTGELEEDELEANRGNNRRETASAEELQLTLQDYQSSTTQQQQQSISNEIVFGNPNNTKQFELANVKQRAEAINIWKAQKEILEKNMVGSDGYDTGGRSRAREWSVLGGGVKNKGGSNRGSRSRGGRKSLGCVRELDTGNDMGLLDYKQPEKSMKKMVVPPSFLSQFESSTPKNDEENENCINGIPTTPRRCASSPSPRNNNSNSSSIPSSPRVALSPRNDPRSPRVALSPRVGSIKLTKKKNVVLSPRSNIPPSPSRHSRTVFSSNHLPPISPRTLPTPRATRASSMSPSMGKERLSSFFEDEEEEEDDKVIKVETRGDMVVPSTQLDSVPPTMPRIEATRDIESTKQDDMIPPSTPISKVMEDAMNFLKINPEGGGQVEPDRSNVFFSDDTVKKPTNHQNDGDNVSNGEDCDELEIAQQLAMALDQFLIQEGGDNSGNNDGYEAVKELMSGGNDVLDVEQLALALDKFLINDNDNIEEEDDDVDVGEVSMVKEEGEEEVVNGHQQAQGWTETQSKDVQVEKSMDDGYEAVKELMNGGNDVLDVEQLALALDKFLINDNDDNIEEEEEEDAAVGEVSMVKEGEDQGWTETLEDVQVEKSTNQDVGDDAFTFPVNFGAFGESSDSFNGGESDVFFPTSFGTDVQPPVTKKASQRPPKKAKKLTITTSFMTNSSIAVDQHKKLHRKIKICIDDAPELNITRKDIAKEENLFYINQPSPSVGDKACLLNGGPQTSSMPPSPALVVLANGVKAVKVSGHSNNKPMLNLRGLLNTARPISKRDVVSIQKGTSIHSPSMIGLLAASSSSNEPSRLVAMLNKNDIVSSSNEKEVVEGQFFVAPATPTMDSYQQISIRSTKKTSDKIVVPSSSTSVGFGSAKKTRKLLQRIKKGSKNKSSSAFGSLLND